MTNSTFEDLGLQQATLEAVSQLGWPSPTEVQATTYRACVDAKDVLVQAQTGSGKTGAFGIPLVDRLLVPGEGLQAVVLAPTRELAKQSAEQIAKLGAGHGLRVVEVYGGTSIVKQGEALATKPEVISATPGRLLDLSRRAIIDLSQVRTVVLDEADEMLSMGFAEDVLDILGRMSKRQLTWLFSATVGRDVQRFSGRIQKSPESFLLASSLGYSKTVDHFYSVCAGVGAKRSALASSLAEVVGERALVFCNTKEATRQVAQWARTQGINARDLSSDLSQSDRESVLASFRSGETTIVVATDVAARGIDVDDVALVVNWDFPTSTEQYVHRAGRTGRAGRAGRALSLVAASDLGTLYYLKLESDIEVRERPLPSADQASADAEHAALSALAKTLPEADASARRLATRLLAQGEAGAALVARLIAQFSPKPETVQARPPRNTNAKKDGQAGRRPRGERRGEAREDARPKSRREERGETRSKPQADQAEHPREETPKGPILEVAAGRRQGLKMGALRGLLAEHLPDQAVERVRLGTHRTLVYLGENEGVHYETLAAALNGQALEGTGPLKVTLREAEH